MLERDYILRLFREFTEALEKVLDKKKKNNIPEYTLQIQSIYRAYFNHSPEFYYEQDAEYIVNELLQTYQGEEMLIRLDMLSELIYNDSQDKNNSEKRVLLNKVLYFLNFIDEHSNTYSIVRQNKIKKIKVFLDT